MRLRPGGPDSPPRGVLEAHRGAGYTRAVDFTEFQSRITGKRPRVAPAYAFAGPEEFLRSEGTRLVRRAVFADGEPDLGVAVFDGPRNDAEASRFDASQFFEEATSFPLLVQRKVVVMRSADRFVSKHRDGVERLVGEPSGFAVVVLECEKMAKNTRLAKAVDSAGGYVECKRLYETEFGRDDVTPNAPLAKWLLSRAAGRELGLEAQAACELIRRVGSSLRELDGALERLELSSSGGSVTRAEVESEFPYTRDYAAVRALDLLDEGNVPGAIDVVRTLYRQGIPEGSGARTVRDPRAISAILVAQLSRYLSRSVRTHFEPRAAHTDPLEDVPAGGPGVGRLDDWVKRLLND